MPDDLYMRTASARANSFDPETRTFEAVIATGNPVRRADALGPYDEILTVSTVEPFTEIPLLDLHNTSTVRAVLGRVLSTRADGDALVAQIRLSSAEDVAPIGQRIADGSLTGLSIGYAVSGWTTTKTRNGREKRPLKWRPTEASLTSNPADLSATIRQKGIPMPDPVIETPNPQEVETQRRSEIRGLVRSAGLAPDVADQLIDQNADLTAAKAAIFDQLETRQRTAPVIRTHAPQNDDPAVLMQRRSEALHIRMAGGEPAPEVRQYMDESFLDMARDSLTRAGMSTRGLSKDEVFTRAAELTTSDFPNLVSLSLIHI